MQSFIMCDTIKFITEYMNLDLCNYIPLPTAPDENPLLVDQESLFEEIQFPAMSLYL